MTTYYVKNGGDDSKDGKSDANAWETIAHVNSQNFANDDIICLKRGSTFTDATLTLDSTSVGRSRITIQDYDTGDKPLIDGNSVVPILINHALVDLTLQNIDISGLGIYGTRCTINSANGLVIDGVDCNGHLGSYTRYRCNAINITDVDGDIEIKNCTIQNLIKDTWADTITSWGDLDAHGILFWNPIDAKKSGTVSVHNNIIHDVYADCVQTACVQTTTNIYNNQFYNFGENAIDHKKGRYINIYNNTISSGGVRDNARCITGGAGTSYCTDCVAQDITVRDNYFYDSPATGIAIGAQGMTNYNVYRNYFKDVGLGIVVGTSANTNIFNNVFDLSEPVESSLLGVNRSGIRVMYTPQSDTKIYNNTLYISSTNHLYGIAVEADADVTGTIIKNNIIHMTRDNSAVFPIRVYDNDNSGTLPTVQYNELYGVHSNRVYIEETPDNWTTYDATEQADWRTAGHTGGLFADPLLANPSGGDLTLQSSSPAINAGADLGATYKMAIDPDSKWPDNVATLDQNSHGDGWEIGAYVHRGAIPAKGQIINLDHPASVEHGAACDINAAIKNIGDLSGQFKTQILIDSVLKATSPEFTLAGGATSTDKIKPFTAPLTGESMDIIIKCIRRE